MQKNTKNIIPDKQEESGNIASQLEKEERKKDLTKEEMEKAQPLPLPQVDPEQVPNHQELGDR
jgi:hypothetical protein